MAGKDTAELIMLSEFGDESFRFRPIFKIARLGPDIHDKRGVMEEQNGGPGSVDRQHALDMLETRPAETALVAVHADRVDHDQPRRKIFDRILDEIHIRADVAAVGKGLDQVAPIVSIAGDDEIGGGQPVQQPLRLLVVFDKAIMRDITSMNDDVGLRPQAIDMQDAGFELGRSRRLVTRQVTVGDLNDPHIGVFPGHDVVVGLAGSIVGRQRVGSRRLDEDEVHG